MQHTDSSFDSRFFRTALGRFPTGVTIITAKSNATDGPPLLGMTVNSFNAVSLAPPLVLWSLALNSSLHDSFVDCSSYVIQILASDQTHLAMQFSRGPASARFGDLAITHAPGGTPMLAAPVAAWFECTQFSQHVAGDHVIMVGEVRHCGHASVPPLVFHAGGFDLTPLPDPTGRPDA